MPYQSKAVRVSDVILKDIWDGAFDPRKYLPSEDQLAERYRLSRMTLRRILAKLEADGILVKVPNRGTRINPSLKLPGTTRDQKTSSRRIAAVMAAFPDILTIELTHGIQAYAEEHGWTLVLLQNTNGPKQLIAELEQIGRHDFDGFLFLNDSYCRTPIARSFSGLEVSTVYLDAVPPGNSGACVGADHYTGGYLAAHHLLEQLKSPNCYFFAENAEYVTVQLRRNGFLQAMTDHGFQTVGQAHCVFFPPVVGERYLRDDHEKNAARAARQLLTTVPHPCGIFCNNDYLARVVAEAAREQTLELGREVLLAGFDDLPFAAAMGLTSIRPDRKKIGYEAAALLADMIDNQCALTLTKSLPVRLIERRSTLGKT